MWSKARLCGLLAVALVGSARAAGLEVAVLPPVTDGAAAMALGEHLAAVGVKATQLSGAQVVEKGRLSSSRYALAVLAGGERFADTIAQDGDAVSALLAYVDGGGSLLVLASGSVLSKPQRWHAGQWESSAAPLRRVSLQTRFGLLDAGQALDVQPPVGSHFVVGPKSPLTARLTGRVLLPGDQAVYRPIPSSQDPSVEFNPWLTLIDQQGGTYGAAFAELRRKGAEQAGAVYYLWAPLMSGPRGRDLLLGLLAARRERKLDEATRAAQKVVLARIDQDARAVETAGRWLPASVSGADVAVLRDEARRYGEAWPLLRDALTVGNEEWVTRKLGELEPEIATLLVRAGRAVDALATRVQANPSPQVVRTRLFPARLADGRPAPVEALGTERPLLPPVRTAALDAQPREPDIGPWAHWTPPRADDAPARLADAGRAAAFAPPDAEPVTLAPRGIATPARTPRSGILFPGVKNPVLEFEVKDRGRFYLELLPDAAPKTCSAILYLARSGYYDRTYFHRRIEQFVVQGGDPFTRELPPDDERIGTGGPDWAVPGEFNNLLTHQRGSVGLARAPRDPDSGGSQFYICLAPQPALDGSYAVFAKVIGGMEVVDKLQIGDRIVATRVAQGADPKNPPGAGPLELFTRPARR